MGKSCSSQFRQLAAVSALVFTGISAAFVLGPEINANTNATEGCSSVDGVVSCSAEAEVNVTVNSVLTIGVKAKGIPGDPSDTGDADYNYNDGDTPARTTLNLGEAVPGGASAKRGVDVKVTTNSENGYRLTMSTATANPYLANSTEADKNAPTKSYFTSAAGDYTVVATTSRWGYSLSDAAGHVEAIPGSANPVALRPGSGDASHKTGSDGKEYTGEASGNSGSVTPVYFFAQANSSMPAGTYQNTVVFSATEAP